MIATPDLSHATQNDWNCIYEPSEDTFLLLDALELDLKFILERKPLFCVEVGAGSGVVICAMASKLTDSLFLATDINSTATAFIQRTSLKNNVHVEVIQCDLLKNFRRNLVDMILFNPPYVVTPSSEISGTGIQRAWAGGIKGREIIDRFVNQVSECLSSRGFGYLLVLEENCPQEVLNNLSSLGYQCKIVLSRKLRGEYLHVLRFTKRF